MLPQSWSRARATRPPALPARSLTVAALVIAAGFALVHGQITIREINPTRSTLDASDPDGASGGRVNGLARSSNAVLYAASEWGGLFKSTDTGRNWSRLDAHLPTATWDVEVSPADANRVIATSFYDGRTNSLAGINVSRDGGASWSRPATATPPAGFCRSADRRDEPSAHGIAFDPSTPANVYAGTNCGLAISNDGGVTWRFVDPTPVNGANDVWDVVVHHGGIIDLCGDDGHRRSTDGGATWTTAAAGGIPLNAGLCSIAASPDEAHVLFAVTGGLIFETDNGGGTWNTQFVNPSPQGRIPFVAVNDRSGRAFDVWFGDVSLHRATCQTPVTPAPGGAARCPSSAGWAGGFTRSAGAHDDTGDLLFSIPPTPPAGFNETLCVSKCEAQRDLCLENGPNKAVCQTQFRSCERLCRRFQSCPLLMSSDGGVYFNTRTTSPTCHDPAWEQPDVTLRALWLFGMGGARTAGPENEQLSFGNQDTGTFATTNAGAATPAWTNRDCCDGFDVAGTTNQVAYTMCCFSPGRANLIFVRGAGMAGGGQIASYPTGNIPGFTAIDVLDRFGPNSYVLITIGNAGARVSVTTNITATPTVNWTQLGTTASTPGNACGIKAAGTAASPVFYAQAGACSGSSLDRLFRIAGTSAATAWQQVAPPAAAGAGAGFTTFAVDRTNPNRLFAAIAAGAGGAQMFRSTDSGATWTQDATLDGLMTGGGTFRARTRRGPTNFTGFGAYLQPSLVAFDPSDVNTLVAASRDAGIFLSRNGGSTWTTITNNSGTAGNPVIPRAQFAYFDRDCGAGHVYVGTQGRGVWRVTFQTRDPGQEALCTGKCEAQRDLCLEEGPNKARCQTNFKTCVARCRCP